jgi:hypothetical protein
MRSSVERRSPDCPLAIYCIATINWPGLSTIATIRNVGIATERNMETAVKHNVTLLVEWLAAIGEAA